MNKREILQKTYDTFTQYVSESDRLRSALELCRCIDFFQKALANKEENAERVNDAFANTSRALLHVVDLLDPMRREVYLERVNHKLAAIHENNGGQSQTFRKLLKLCMQVIGLLRIPEEQLSGEYAIYQEECVASRKMACAAIVDFLFQKKVLTGSKFDSAKKALLHRFVERYGEERMLQTSVYRDYLEYRDTNKLRINTVASILGWLEELVLLSDRPSSVVEPLVFDIRAKKKFVAEHVSTSEDQQDIDPETFDVDEYLKTRFTKEYEAGHTRPDMDVGIVEDIDALALRTLRIVFPSLDACPDTELQERLNQYIAGEADIPHSAYSVPHIYDEGDGSA